MEVAAVENDISEKLKLLSDTQKQHLLARLKNQNEHQKALQYVRDYNLVLISSMRFASG